LLILGIDPGTIRCGFGIIEKNSNKKLSHVSHGTIMLDARLSINERLPILAQDLSTLIKKYKPDCAVVEDVFVFKNARSALLLGQARGAALAVLGLNNIKTHSFSPTSAKSLVAGHGRAQKFQVAHMVALQLNIPIPQSQDASDALSLALAQALADLT
jgi:crossover junction endodeoxyribonuclease RuvC